MMLCTYKVNHLSIYYSCAAAASSSWRLTLKSSALRSVVMCHLCAQIEGLLLIAAFLKLLHHHKHLLLLRA
jgi:hypothetical protein